jgi:zinc protease
MTRRFAIFLFFSACSGWTFADDALPKAETILDRFIEVTGGRAAYEKRKSEVMTGHIEMTAQNVKGTLTRYSAPPDKSYTVMELDGVGKIEEGAAGGVAWENNPMTGPRVKSGEEKTQSLREATFNGPLNWQKMYVKAETTGVETIDGEECYKVVLTPAEGKPETTYYQKKSGLVVRTTTVASSPMGEFPVEQDVSDYKNFDGVLLPTKMIQKVAGQEIVFTIDSVKVNEEIAADRFNPPAEIKALMEKK